MRGGDSFPGTWKHGIRLKCNSFRVLERDGSQMTEEVWGPGMACAPLAPGDASQVSGLTWSPWSAGWRMGPGLYIPAHDGSLSQTIINTSQMCGQSTLHAFWWLWRLSTGSLRLCMGTGYPSLSVRLRRKLCLKMTRLWWVFYIISMTNY